MTTLLIIFALVISLNATIHTQPMGSSCSNIVSGINVYATIVEPVQNIVTSYKPILILKTSKPMNMNSLKAMAFVQETRQSVPLAIKQLDSHTFSLYTIASVPLSLSISYKIDIIIGNKTCILVVKTAPPKVSKQSLRTTTKHIIITKTRQVRVPGLPDYDPLKLISTNVSMVSAPNGGQNQLVLMNQAKESPKASGSGRKSVLLAIALGFFVAALIGLIVDYFYSRQSAR